MAMNPYEYDAIKSDMRKLADQLRKLPSGEEGSNNAMAMSSLAAKTQALAIVLIWENTEHIISQLNVLAASSNAKESQKI